MIIGEPVMVATRVVIGRDAGNNLIYDYAEMTVENVLIAPGAAQEISGSVRPEGVEIAYTLYFPKGFTKDLRGAIVTVRGVEFKVVGDPKPYPPHLTPTPWNLIVEVVCTDG